MPTPKFTKGHPALPGAGRPPGSPNKFTSLKQSFIDAFNSPQLRGTDGLTDWAKVAKNQTEFYRILSKLFPTEVKVSGSVNLSDRSEDDLKKILKDLGDDKS